ncbi:MAG TPA: chemotaxis protein CheW [Kofleriaceae bacterium]|nr:chemotaxis protein CheW [Kofleriaceae bacterium]
MSAVDLKTFITGYLAEVEEHLRMAERNLLEAERVEAAGGSSARQVRALFRSMHTIKGLSAMVGVEPVVDLAHEMEAALRVADRSGTPLGGAVDLLVRGLRAVEARVRALASGEAVPPAPADLIDALAALGLDRLGAEVGDLGLPEDVRSRLGPGETQELAHGLARGRRAVRVDFVPSPSRAASGLNITAVRERLGRLGDLVKVIPMSVPRSPEAPVGLSFAVLMLTGAADAEIAEAAGMPLDAVSSLVGAQPAAAPAALPPPAEDEEEVELRGEVVRVPVARLDDVLDRLSVLVVSRSRIARAVAELASRGVDVGALSHVVQESTRHLRDLRAAIMRARMVSLAELLERVPLIVRGLSRTVGKEIKLDLDAGRAELDKAVGERLFPAVVHLVRNAVDHAIEPADERERAGKPRAGHIRVACHERGQSQLELQVIDDGRGIDQAALARRAGRDEPRDPEELLALLTEVGLSTRDQATTTSGRGVGMDIVKRVAVDQLGGELMVATERGRGTAFTIRVPLSLTIVDAFCFHSGERTYVVPMSMVDEIVELEPDRVHRPPALAGALVGLLDRRGEAIPVVDLEAWFARRPAGGGGRKAILVRRRGRPLAFTVDRMLGKQEVVVRPLEDPLVRVPGVSGTTDLGDGRPTLVLDFLALGGQVRAAQGGP